MTNCNDGFLLGWLLPGVSDRRLKLRQYKVVEKEDEVYVVA
jgi:hypothetical protein